MRENVRRMVQCPGCGRGIKVSVLRALTPTHPGGVYDHITWSPGKGNIHNEIIPVEDEEVIKELVRRCRAFLKRFA